MTTLQAHQKLHPDDRVYIFDSVGLLAVITPDQAKEALRRREIRPTEFPERYVLIPRALAPIKPRLRKAHR